MADFTITHRIEAPELTAALNNLADALKSRPVAAPAAQEATTRPVQENPVQAPTVAPTPAEQPTPTNAPVTNTVNGTTPATTDAPAPGPAPSTVTAPVTAATSNPAPAPAKVYTFDDITRAGSQLLEMNKMPQLMELLKGYGVQAVTQLKPEQYTDVAAGLRGLGANI